MEIAAFRRSLTLSSATLALIACGVPAGSEMSEQLRGDTLVLRARGAEVPTAPREELRLSGDQPHIMLGEVTALAALPDGGVVVFDARNSRGLALLEFDARGTLVRVLGRQGSGPGEYGSSFIRLAVHGDGTVFLHDLVHNRINRYRQGSPLPAVRMPSSLGGGLAGTQFLVLRDHSVLLNGSLRVQQTLGAPYFVRVDSNGTLIDSVVARGSWMTPAESELYGADEMVAAHPDGGWVHFRTDRIGFLRRDARGTVLLTAEVSGSAPWFRPEERRELQRIEEWSAAGRRPARDVPARKQLVREGLVDPNGRLWVQRTTEAFRIPSELKYWGTRGRVHVSWGEPVRLAGFEASGRYLGEWIFPVRSRVAIYGNTVWAVMPDSLDVPTLVKYSLDP